jgi:CelD/BcsL family acetyltransferase involved in cellulose biosynthesis
MIAVEVFAEPAAVERHRADWMALFAASTCEPCTAYEWVRAMCDAHLRRGDAFHLLVLRRDGRVCGLVPLVTARESLGGVAVRTLQPLMERYRTHSDLLVPAADAETATALAGAIRALPGGWDVFRLIQILESNPLLEPLDAAFRATGATVLRRPEAPSFYLPLPATFEAYLAGRSSKFRNHLRRMEKKLAATGPLAVTTAGVDLDVETAFDALLAVEAKSWKHAHGTAITAVPHQTVFYRSLVRDMAASGALHLTFLTVGGETIAYNLGLVCRGEYAYLKTSYVEALKALGPAVVLRARLIERLIAAGVSALDFPAEPYEWESQWTSDHRPHQSIVVYNRTLRGRALSLLRRWRDRRTPAADGIAYANARDLRAPGEDA